MNIGTHLLNNYDTGLQKSVRTEQSKNKGNVEGTRASLSNLKEGSVFKGEIVDVAGERATISLENQETVMAKMKQDVELNVGDKLLFSVEENNSEQVLIKPMFDSLYSAEMQTLEKILGGAGLSPTEKNFTAAKELMDAGMPVDKASLVKVLSQSMKFPNTPMSTLVALNKMNIPVNEANIAQYERYQNLNHAISNDIADTAKVMSDFASQLPEQLSGEELLSFAKDVIQLFSNENGDVRKNASSENQLLTTDNMNMEVVAESASLESEQVESNLQMPKQEGMIEDNSMEGKMLSKPEENTSLIGQKQEVMLQDHIEKTEQSTQALQNSQDGNSSLEGQLMSRLESAGLSKDDAMQIVKNFDGKPDNINMILNSGESSIELVKNLTEALSKSNLDTETIRNALSQDGFKKLFSQMIKESWSLDPKTMSDPREIDDLYQKVEKESKAFEEMLSSKGGNTDSFQQGSQNMRQNMSFMEQINQQMIYAQMPLKLSNQQANSELFVYADKRRLVEKKDGISVMLHLDMDHLGMTDVKVTLTGKNVNARFYFNDQKSVDIVAQNMGELEQKLLERGFTLSNEVVKRKSNESVNQVVNEIIDENAEKSVKRYTFDVKM